MKQKSVIAAAVPTEMQEAFTQDLEDLMLKYQSHFPYPEFMIAILARGVGRLLPFCHHAGSAENLSATVDLNIAAGLDQAQQELKAGECPFGGMKKEG